MSWFQKLCRNTGLMIHNIAAPMQEEKKKRTEVSRKTEEKRIDETTVLRRTTIDEVEVRREKKDA